eukprot:gnl/TRDRNA2_/TRDRNA2_200456_c0_seq1.p1 gnl/TRDRNA2_/TRDRNA2_200456_c0~~gnl/TRDRNA2_/TRDRNA2_200456_c0_seq1.p1  ORF type:complete len:229 (-),score=28.40 gnl/TRDRNA2_/TRDRNA2_200456_c0_seq1:46-732(-)
MHHATVINLLACIVHAHAQELVAASADKLVSRVHKSSPGTDLENTTLAKHPGHLALGPKMIPSLVGSVPSARRPTILRPAVGAASLVPAAAQVLPRFEREHARLGVTRATADRESSASESILSAVDMSTAEAADRGTAISDASDVGADSDRSKSSTSESTIATLDALLGSSSTKDSLDPITTEAEVEDGRASEKDESPDLETPPALWFVGEFLIFPMLFLLAYFFSKH